MPFCWWDFGNLSGLVFYYDWIKVSLAYSKKWKILTYHDYEDIYMMTETEGQLWETYIILGIVS